MDVQAAQAGQFQHPLRQDQTVGRHDHDVGRHALKQGTGLGGLIGIAAIQPQAARLGDRNAGVQRGLLDRAGRELQAPSRRPVRLRHDKRDFVSGGPQGVERDTGEFRGAGENDAHEWTAEDVNGERQGGSRPGVRRAALPARPS